MSKILNYVGNPFSNPSIISYCTGIRGLERGLERAIGSVRTVAILEVEAFIIENLLAGMEAGLVDAAPIWCNLKTFDATPFRGKVHGIIGGYPCQPFSMAGKRKGTEDPRHLWPYLLRDIKAINPVWCFFENVSGHLTLGYDEVYRSLSDLGYAVEAGLYTAAEAGAPHERERLFILAINRSFLENSDCIRQGQHLGRNEYKREGANSEAKRGGLRAETVAAGEKLGDTRLLGQAQRQEPTTGVKQSSETELGNSESFPTGGLPIGTQEEQPEFGKPSEKLAIPDSIGHIHGQPEQHPTEGGEYAQRNLTTGCGKELADPNKCRSEQDTEPTELRADSVKQPPGDSWHTYEAENFQRRCDRWPARPGEPQYEWEEPRTVKPGLGSTINGYNFREDLLRAYGNGVVEQTAEIAFLDLLSKHNLL